MNDFIDEDGEVIASVATKEHKARTPGPFEVFRMLEDGTFARETTGGPVLAKTRTGAIEEFDDGNGETFFAIKAGEFRPLKAEVETQTKRKWSEAS